MSDLASKGERIKIKGSHPWHGHFGTVIAVEPYGLRRELAMRVAIERNDAMNGHECYVPWNAWKLAPKQKGVR